MALRRLDSELVRRNLAKSRAQAQALIAAGAVKVSGQVARKPATQIDTGAPVVVTEPPTDDYVSRGAHKLLGALDALGSQAPKIVGRRCLDAGASTGGFTDVLLRQGADSVVAVDVGYGQLAWRLRSDPKVQVLERTNIRYLEAEQVAPAPELVVGDLSFISLELIIPALLRCAPEADYLLMVKPQFEVGKSALGKGGVVRDPQQRADAVTKVAEFAASQGLVVWAIEASPLPGPAGNVEYFLAMSGGGDRTPILDLAAAAKSAVERGPHPEIGTLSVANAPAGNQSEPVAEQEGSES